MCLFFPAVISVGQPGMFGREEFEQLAPVVDGFSLMTYDYSSGARWVSQKSDVRRSIMTNVSGSDMIRVTDSYKKIHSINADDVLSYLVFFFSSSSIDRARAPHCPGWETVFSSLLQTLSGGKRSCWDSICTALILQAREQSRSWEEGRIILCDYCKNILAIKVSIISNFKGALCNIFTGCKQMKKQSSWCKKL